MNLDLLPKGASTALTVLCTLFVVSLWSNRSQIGETVCAAYIPNETRVSAVEPESVQKKVRKKRSPWASNTKKRSVLDTPSFDVKPDPTATKFGRSIPKEQWTKPAPTATESAIESIKQDFGLSEEQLNELMQNPAFIDHVRAREGTL